MSRQLVGALEGGRHLPRVDAALALAAALDTTVASLFGSARASVDVVTGEAPEEGQLLRVGRVGELQVTSPCRTGQTGWDVADAVFANGELDRLSPFRPGVVMAGCEPGLEFLERSLREGGKGAMAVACSSAAAAEALGRGRAHAVVVHADSEVLGGLPGAAQAIRYRLCRWQVGLAGPRHASPDWFRSALAGRTAVAQRERGAGVQAAFERSATAIPPGPIVSGHLEAARLTLASGIPAVTIEPAARAVGADFHPLEFHEAQLWIAPRWVGDSSVEAVMNELTGARFRRRLEGVGGYDLSGSGTRAA